MKSAENHNLYFSINKSLSQESSASNNFRIKINTAKTQMKFLLLVIWKKTLISQKKVRQGLF